MSGIIIGSNIKLVGFRKSISSVDGCGYGHYRASFSNPRHDETFGHGVIFLLPGPQKGLLRVTADGGHSQFKELNDELLLVRIEHD